MACGRHPKHRAGCPACCEDSRRYAARRLAALAAGTWQRPVPVDQVRAHLRTLTDAGLTLVSIARLTGVSAREVGAIHGDRRTAPRTVLGTTAALLLAVTPDTPPVDHTRALPAGRVDPTIATRKVRAMARLGHPLVDQAVETGTCKGVLWAIADGSRVHIDAGLAGRIDALYLRWSTWVRPGVAAGRSRTANRALKHGWLGPGAWDNISDPACRPDTADTPEPDPASVLTSAVDDGVAGRAKHGDLTPAELAEVVRLLARDGWSDAAIGVHLAWPRHARRPDSVLKGNPAVLKFRTRHGIATNAGTWWAGAERDHLRRVTTAA